VVCHCYVGRPQIRLMIQRLSRRVNKHTIHVVLVPTFLLVEAGPSLSSAHPLYFLLPPLLPHSLLLFIHLQQEASPTHLLWQSPPPTDAPLPNISSTDRRPCYSLLPSSSGPVHRYLGPWGKTTSNGSLFTHEDLKIYCLSSINIYYIATIFVQHYTAKMHGL
jgi:hypothetical protein